MMLLDRIHGPEDLRGLSQGELEELAGEIRRFIIEKTSIYGGHLASNLGVVELTIGLYLALDLPRDKIVWDVGHQSYTHKILSGRKDNFDGLRQYGGMSGFPKRSESEFDCFDTGHSSTSISAGLGIAEARDIRGEDFTVVSVIGDGALTGGMAYEALNNAAQMQKNFIVVLNDNNMSISQNVGGMSRYLNGIRVGKGYNQMKRSVGKFLLSIPSIGKPLIRRLQKTKNSIKQLLIPGMLFENMGVTYLGPVDGHDIRAVERVICEAKKLNHTVLVHVITKKGKGYRPAELSPCDYHGVGPFEIVSGRPKGEKGGESYTDVFSRTLLGLGERDSRIVAVTAAMPDGTGLRRFGERFPERFFDVGIAEQHAVTFAAGMASEGLRPVVAVYSSFLQRAYDQIVHDVCLPKLPVVFAVDRAGLVGSDGETHQGIFDFSYLTSIPNMTVMAPKNARELEDMLSFALKQEGPVSIRYPRGRAWTGLSELHSPLVFGKAELLFEGRDIALIAAGSMVSTALHIREKLIPSGLEPTLVNARFIKPIDTGMLDRLISSGCRTLITLEENVKQGGFGLEVLDYINRRHRGILVHNVTLSDCYVEHGDVTKLREGLRIDSDSIIFDLRKEGVIH